MLDPESNLNADKTKVAASTSPARQKKESIAALALYLASRLVGKNSAWRVVF
jgi:hypothetical protein